MKSSIKSAILAAAAAGMMASGVMAEESKKTLTLNGWVVSSYSMDINKATSAFAVNQTIVKAIGTDESLGIKGALTMDPSLATSLCEAYVEKSAFDVTIKLGKFDTFQGYESTYLGQNANVSKSLVANKELSNHKGALVTYGGIKDLTVGLLAANSEVAGQFGSFATGSGSYTPANSNDKDFGALVTYSIAGVNVGANYIYGTFVQASTTPAGALHATDENGNIHMVNATVSYAVGDIALVAAEYLHRSVRAYYNATSQYEAYGYKDQGYSLYSSVYLGDLTISPRFSQYFYPDLTSDPSQINQLTLTGKYKIGALVPFVEVDAETNAAGKYLTSSNDILEARTSKTTVSVGASYEF